MLFPTRFINCFDNDHALANTVDVCCRYGAKMDHLQILDSLLKKDYDRRATPTNHLSK